MGVLRKNALKMFKYVESGFFSRISLNWHCFPNMSFLPFFRVFLVKIQKKTGKKLEFLDEEAEI